jgi:hypothetical protein
VLDEDGAIGALITGRTDADARRWVAGESPPIVAI